MSVLVQTAEAEPPLAPGAALVGKVSRLLLLAVCAGPIAAFPIGLAYKGYMHFVGASAPSSAGPATSSSLHCRRYSGCTPAPKAAVESARH